MNRRILVHDLPVRGARIAGKTLHAVAPLTRAARRTGASHASSVPVVYTSIVLSAMSGNPKSACSISPCSVTRSVPSIEPGGSDFSARCVGPPPRPTLPPRP